MANSFNDLEFHTRNLSNPSFGEHEHGMVIHSAKYNQYKWLSSIQGIWDFNGFYIVLCLVCGVKSAVTRGSSAESAFAIHEHIWNIHTSIECIDELDEMIKPCLCLLICPAPKPPYDIPGSNLRRSLGWHHWQNGGTKCWHTFSTEGECIYYLVGGFNPFEKY